MNGLAKCRLLPENGPETFDRSFFLLPNFVEPFFSMPPQEQHSRLPFLKNFETLTRGHLGRLRKSSGRASPQSLRQARQGARGELQAMYAELEELQQPSWAAKQRARERVAAADRRPPGLPGGGVAGGAALCWGMGDGGEPGREEVGDGMEHRAGGWVRKRTGRRKVICKLNGVPKDPVKGKKILDFFCYDGVPLVKIKKNHRKLRVHNTPICK